MNVLGNLKVLLEYILRNKQAQAKIVLSDDGDSPTDQTFKLPAADNSAAETDTLVAENKTQILKNKEIDADKNDISNIKDININENANIKGSKLLDGSVEDVKIVDLDGQKLFDGSVDTTQLADDSVTNDKIETIGQEASGAVVDTDSSQTLSNKSFDFGENIVTIPDNSVDAKFLLDDSVDNSKLKSGIEGSKLVDSSVEDVKIVDLDGQKLFDGSVDTLQLADDSVTNSKIETLGQDTSGAVVDTDSAQTISNKSFAFDENAVTIPDNSVDAKFIKDDTIDNSKLKSGINGSKLVDNTVSNEKLMDGIDGSKLINQSVDTTQLKDGSVTTDKLADGSVTFSKLEADLYVGRQGVNITGNEVSVDLDNQPYLETSSQGLKATVVDDLSDAVTGKLVDSKSIKDYVDAENALMVKLDGSRPLTGDWDNSSGTVTVKVPEPKLPSDAVSKNYVDTVLVSGAAFWTPVESASSDSEVVDLDTSIVSIGGENVVVGKRYLLWQQADSSENGIYTSNSDSTLSRSNDADEGDFQEFQVNKTVSVLSGTYAGSTFAYTGDSNPAIGSDGITFDLKARSNLADGSITSATLAEGSVVTSKIADGDVTNEKLASGIDGSKLIDGSVTTAKVANGSIDDSKISNVDGSKLNDLSVTREKIADGAIDADKLDVAFVFDGVIANGSIEDIHIEEYIPEQVGFEFGPATIISSDPVPMRFWDTSRNYYTPENSNIILQVNGDSSSTWRRYTFMLNGSTELSKSQTTYITGLWPGNSGNGYVGKFEYTFDSGNTYTITRMSTQNDLIGSEYGEHTYVKDSSGDVTGPFPSTIMADEQGNKLVSAIYIQEPAVGLNKNGNDPYLKLEDRVGWQDILDEWENDGDEYFNVSDIQIGDTIQCPIAGYDVAGPPAGTVEVSYTQARYTQYIYVTNSSFLGGSYGFTFSETNPSGVTEGFITSTDIVGDFSFESYGEEFEVRGVKGVVNGFIECDEVVRRGAPMSAGEYTNISGFDLNSSGQIITMEGAPVSKPAGIATFIVRDEVEYRPPYSSNEIRVEDDFTVDGDPRQISLSLEGGDFGGTVLTNPSELVWSRSRLPELVPASGGISSNKIWDNSIDTSKLMDGIDGRKLIDKSVDTTQLTDNSVTHDKLEVTDIDYSLLDKEDPFDTVVSTISTLIINGTYDTRNADSYRMQDFAGDTWEVVKPLKIYEPAQFPPSLDSQAEGYGRGYGEGIAKSKDILFMGSPRSDVDPRIAAYNTNNNLLYSINPPSPDNGNFGEIMVASDLFLVTMGLYNNIRSIYVYDPHGDNPTTPIHTITKDNSGLAFEGTLTLAIENEKLVVGATGSFAGGVYIYDLLSDTPEIAVGSVLYPSDAGSYPQFGCSVAIANGKIVVGAKGAREVTESYGVKTVGRVYVYDETTKDLIKTIPMPSSDLSTSTQFGAKVGITPDGVTIVISDIGSQIAGVYNSGAVYAYNQDTGDVTSWVSSIPYAGGYFGKNLSVSNSIIAVGDERRNRGVLIRLDTGGTTAINPPFSGSYFGLGIFINENELVIADPLFRDTNNDYKGKICRYSVSSKLGFKFVNGTIVYKNNVKSTMGFQDFADHSYYGDWSGLNLEKGKSKFGVAFDNLSKDIRDFLISMGYIPPT